MTGDVNGDLLYTKIYSVWFGKSVQAGKGAMRLTPCEAPTRETRPDHYTGSSVPYFDGDGAV